MRRNRWKILFLSGVLLLIPILSSAQPYPTKPINILVGFAPGGTMDVSTRVLAGKAEKFLGQPFLVSNNGGGGGSVALGIVA
jgi:tripartite-type tricarboxylate transporter receptor subunit TctC